MTEVPFAGGTKLAWGRVRESLGLASGAEIGLRDAARAVVRLYPEIAGGLLLLPDTKAADGMLERSADLSAAAEEDVFAEAKKVAVEFGSAKVFERHLFGAILRRAGLPLRPVQTESPAAEPSRTPARSQKTPGPKVDSVASAPSEGAPRWNPTAACPNLEQMARDLTAEAVAGRLRPVIGRESELDALVEILCRERKRNPLVVGPAGVGKTVLVDGLSQRMASGQVPPLLRDARVFALQVGDLTRGTGMMGALEEKLAKVVSEAS